MNHTIIISNNRPVNTSSMPRQSFITWLNLVPRAKGSIGRLYYLSCEQYIQDNEGTRMSRRYAEKIGA